VALNLKIIKINLCFLKIIFQKKRKKKKILTFTLRIELLLFPSYKKLGFLRVNPSPPCSIIFSNSSSKCSFPLHFENLTIWIFSFSLIFCFKNSILSSNGIIDKFSFPKK